MGKDDYLFEPKITWGIHDFDYRVYSRWAADEIIKDISKSIKTPVEVVEEFVDKMDGYGEVGDDRHRQLIFFMARDAAEEILYFLKGENK